MSAHACRCSAASTSPRHARARASCARVRLLRRRTRAGSPPQPRVPSWRRRQRSRSPGEALVQRHGALPQHPGRTSRRAPSGGASFVSSALVVVCERSFRGESLRATEKGVSEARASYAGPRIVSTRSPYSATSPFRIASASGGASSGARRSNRSNGSSVCASRRWRRRRARRPRRATALRLVVGAAAWRRAQYLRELRPGLERPRVYGGRGLARARARARARRLAGTGMGIPAELRRPPGRRRRRPSSPNGAR